MGDNTKTAELCRMDPASSAALYGRSICGSIGLPAWAQRLCDAWCTPSVVVVVALAAVVLVMAATACRLDDAKWRRAASGGSASGDGGGIGAKLPGAMPRVPARIRLPWTMCRITSPPLAAVYRIPFWWGPSRVVVTDPRLVADVVRHQRVLQRRSDFGMHWLLDAMLGQSLVAKDGDDWHRVLAAFRRPFAPGHVRANMSHAVHIVEAWAGGLLPDADGSRTISVLDLVDPPFRAVAVAMYGNVLTPQRERQLKWFWREMDAITSATFTNRWAAIPGYSKLSTRLAARVARFRHDWECFNRDIFRDTQHESGAMLQELAREVMQAPADATRPFKQGIIAGLSPAEIFDTLNEIILANADFVAAAVMWPLVHMALHPSVLEGVHKELSAAGCGTSDVAAARGLASPTPATAPPTELRQAQVDRVANLKLLSQVVMESWRLEPMFVVTNPIINPAPITVGGFRVPAGSHIVYDTSAINRSTYTWGDTADDFVPGRAAQSHVVGHPQQHIFGLGMRRCLGQHYALLFVKLHIVAVLRRFNVRAVPTAPAADESYGPFKFPPFTLELTAHKHNR